MSLAIFSFVSIFYFYFVFLKKQIFFGFKETFSLGLIFYIYLPLVIYFLFKGYLIASFEGFNGYTDLKLRKLLNLTSFMIISFITGYFSINKKINILNLKENYSTKVILFTLIVYTFLIFFKIPNINPFVTVSILSSLLIYKSNKSIFKKILYLTIIMLILQYLSAKGFNSRRDIVKIFLITFFFMSLVFSNKKLLYLLIITFGGFLIVFVILATYFRTTYYAEQDFLNIISIGLRSFVGNYDFFPAFDHMISIINNENNFLYGKSLFKIFFSIIPREFWPSKPLETTTLIVSLRENPFVGGTAHSVTLLGEVYWNFGWISVFFIFYLLGVFAKSFDLNKNKNLTDLQIIVLASLSYLIFILWRGGISTTLIIFLINLFYLVFVLKFLKFLFRKR